MKILFIGEFSGLHTSLAAGLRALGHKTLVSASGDGYKQIKVDRLLHREGGGPVKSLARRFRTFRDLPLYSGYDIVQLIHPFVVGKDGYNAWFVRELKRRNGRLLLTAAGSDPLAAIGIFSRGLRYSFLHAMLASGPDTKEHHDALRLLRPDLIERNREILGLVNGVIPFSYEYKLGYDHSAKCLPMSPYPLDLAPFAGETAERRPGPLRVFHGISRGTFKGSPIIRKAMESVAATYGDRVVCTVTERLPYEEYLQTIGDADILVDQCNSYGYSMNALIGMAKGKIVFSGAEPEALASLGIAREDCPVVNIVPDADQIMAEIAARIDRPEAVSAERAASLRYVREKHDAVRVASRYLELCVSVGA